MAGAVVFCHRELRTGFCGDPGHATDNLRNSDILIHLCDYGFRGAFAVVSTKQWFSIDGGKHTGWISLTNVALVPLILKCRLNSFNICHLKIIETYFIWYQNFWKHCIVIITMLIITMSHLIPFFFFLILNLTDVCSEISFREGSYCAGTIHLIYGANHLTGSCMVQVFAGGCFRADFSCLIFCHFYPCQ